MSGKVLMCTNVIWRSICQKLELSGPASFFRLPSLPLVPLPSLAPPPSSLPPSSPLVNPHSPSLLPLIPSPLLPPIWLHVHSASLPSPLSILLMGCLRHCHQWSSFFYLFLFASGFLRAFFLFFSFFVSVLLVLCCHGIC